MKIFITGHLGFIGSHLTKRLDAEGIEWIGYDLKKHDDIRDEINLDIKMRQLGSQDIVIHLAALAGVRDGEKRPADYLDTNVTGTQQVINMCKRYKVKHLISFSSSSVLGNQNPPNSESEEMKPIAVYGISKMTGEWLVRHSGLSASIVRPFTVYGENGRPNQVIMKWIGCIKNKSPLPFFGDGNTKRGYTYVGDLLDGVMAIVKKSDELVQLEGKHRCQIYHLGGTEVISLNDLLAIFKEVVPEIEVDRQELPFGDVSENWADLTKAKNALGYKGDTPFKQKVIEIIKTELNI